MVPSGCWLFSRMATSRREVARPEPLSVCTRNGLSEPDLARIFERLAWKSRQLETEETS